MTATIICSIIGSGALASLVTAIYNAIVRKNDKDDAIMLMMYHIIKKECMDYIRDGHIASEELEVLIKMHETYHKRGGNGYLDRLMNGCKQLPIID